jgi:hypothetical protein
MYTEDTMYQIYWKIFAITATKDTNIQSVQNSQWLNKVMSNYMKLRLVKKLKQMSRI